jgi:solute carrier family 35 protein E1
MSNNSKSILSSIQEISYFIFLFIIWYGFNAGYNVYNSKTKSSLSYPIFISILQLIMGLIYVVPLWLLRIRKLPNLTFTDIFNLLPIVSLNAIGHTSAVIAMFEKGGGSFTHVIKASEPVVSSILSLVINKILPTPLAGLSLLPITYGVAYASTLGDLSIPSMAKELTTKAAM